MLTGVGITARGPAPKRPVWVEGVAREGGIPALSVSRAWPLGTCSAGRCGTSLAVDAGVVGGANLDVVGVKRICRYLFS